MLDSFILLVLVQDGTTLRDFDLAAELAGRYFLLVFFPMDFSQEDAAEIRSLAAQLPEFTFNKTKVVAVSADSSFVTRSAFIPIIVIHFPARLSYK
jgi:alkyl hydroperoxide reductase subunit AhpC